MLSGLKQSLKQGDSFPITLSFAKAGPVTATATVAKAGATMPSMDRGNMSSMGHADAGREAALVAMGQ